MMRLLTRCVSCQEPVKKKNKYKNPSKVGGNASELSSSRCVYVQVTLEAAASRCFGN